MEIVITVIIHFIYLHDVCIFEDLFLRGRGGLVRAKKSSLGTTFKIDTTDQALRQLTRQVKFYLFQYLL